MNGGLNDAVVIGVILCLLFAAVSYYLYSRVVQLEKKVGYMENILLDFKTTFEQTLTDFTTESPTLSGSADATRTAPLTESGAAVTEDEEEFVPASAQEEVRHVQVETARSRTPVASTPVQIVREEKAPVVSANYEANTYKELLQIAKQKGVTGGTHMTKSELIAAIRRKDAGQPVKEAPATWTAFMDSQGQAQGTPLSQIQTSDDSEEGVQAEPLSGESGLMESSLEDEGVEQFVQE